MPSRGKACAALRLVLEAGVTDPELFILMELGSVPKSRRMRIFDSSAIRRRRFTIRHLRAAGEDLGRILQSLANKGFLSRVGRHRHVCTREGDLVKHEFSELSDRLQMHRSGVALGAGPAWTRELVRVLRAICRHQP